MNYTQGDYSRHYITEALFKLMESTPYKDITVSDISKKAGVGRATFYRYFTCKEDVVSFFFEHTKSEFGKEQIYRPRCKEDYEDIIKRVVRYISENKKRLQLLCEARLEYLYFDYVDKALAKMMSSEEYDESEYKAAGYAGAISNITLHWIKNDCKGDEKEIFDALSAISLGGYAK